MNSNVPSRSSKIATSAGARTLSVPRLSKDGKTRAALTVAHATTWLSGIPNMMNFDMTFGKSTTPVHIDAFIHAYNDKAEPFAWTKKKVRRRRFKGRRITQL
jgi:hypothetical protein